MRIKLGPAFGRRPPWPRLALAACLLLLPGARAAAQLNTSEAKGPASAGLNRARALSMLDHIKDVLKEEYYDKGLRAIDLDRRFKGAAERIKKLDNNWQMFPVIAQLLLEFNDSHTRFIPPARSDRVEYGISLQMVGETCYVVDVKKGSDAEAQGVRVGDVALRVGQHPLTREDLWRINYLIYQLAPRPDLPVTLRGDGGAERRLVLKAGFKSLEERRREARRRRDELSQSPFKCVALGDLVMSDGQRLEGRGVVPDVTAGARARGEDPVLAYAAHLFGAPVGAEEAGKFYFLTKSPEDEDEEEGDGGADK